MFDRPRAKQPHEHRAGLTTPSGASTEQLLGDSRRGEKGRRWCLPFADVAAPLDNDIIPPTGELKPL